MLRRTTINTSREKKFLSLISYLNTSKFLHFLLPIQRTNTTISERNNNVFFIAVNINVQPIKTGSILIFAGLHH
jgi:hypothetical protein